MLDRKERIKELIVLERIGELSEEDRVELQEWINLSQVNRDWYEYMRNNLQLLRDVMIYRRVSANKEGARIKLHRMIGQEESSDMGEPTTAKLRFLRWPSRAVAAAVVLLTIGAGVWYYKYHAHAEVSVAQENTNDLAPGGNKAILTLANGSKVILDNVQKGAIARQGGINVVKLDSGLIAYNNNATHSNVTPAHGQPEAVWNTITTPRGGQYEVVLPDGSKVWLNAASSLRFPTFFSGLERQVVLTGEGYFTIAKEKDRPFKVEVGGMKVEVLGTSFNVMAYDDERAVKTTLLEGSVKVGDGAVSRVLVPNQQAQWRGDGSLAVVAVPNAEDEIAWKEGLFSFRSADIETVMRSLSRWYDVEVRYDGARTNHRLTALVRRDYFASDVLQILESSGYHFKIQGKTIVVLP